MRFYYQKKHLDYLRDHSHWDYTVLAWALNQEFGLTKTTAQVRSAFSNHKIKRGRWQRPGTRLLTRAQVIFLKKNYKSLTIKEVTVALNATFGSSYTEKQIRCFTRNHRIKSGRTGCFDKGNRPWNTGTKGLTGPNSGTFKKGNAPPNRRPLGAERICAKDGYILVKIPEVNPHTGFDGRWRAKHIVIWEAEHGPVPEGFILRFKDNNKMHCTIENLELVSRPEHLYLNRYNLNGLADELKPTLRTLAKVVVKAGSLQK